MAHLRGWCWVWLSLAVLTSHANAQTVVSWNLEWFPGRQPEGADAAAITQQMAQAQAELKRLNPDIFIGLEMRDHEVFDQLVSVVPGMQVAVVTAFRDEDGTIDKQQIGIASRFPIYTAWAESWMPTMARLPRGFAVTAVREPYTHKLLVVYGVHFKSNRAQSERETELNIAMRNESAHQLANDFDELRRLVVREDQVRGWIIAGDFNTNHDGQFEDKAIRILEKAGIRNTWTGIAAEDRHTWSNPASSFQPTTLDYIMTQGLGSLTARVVDASVLASDHKPVLLELGLAPSRNK